MKILIAAAALILSSISAQAYVLEAKPVGDLMKLIQNSTFKYKETGMAFGFNSIKSCMYVAPGFAILKNYCVPKKEYPAKGFTIISPKFGIIDLYQENLETVFKRDIMITTFPDILKDYINVPVNNEDLAGINKILEKTYYLYGPACWSTNADYNDEKPQVKCSGNNNVIGFDTWASETQAITGDLKSWKNLMEAVETAVTKNQLGDQ